MIQRQFRVISNLPFIFNTKYFLSTGGLFSKQKIQQGPPKQEQTKEFANLLPKLKEKKVDSLYFQEQAKSTLETLTKQLLQKNSSEDRKLEYKLHDYFLTLAKSLKHLNQQSVLEILSIFLKNDNPEILKVEIIDEILISLTDIVIKYPLSKDEYETIYSSLLNLLQKARSAKSVKVFSNIIRDIDYHEQFDQKDIEIFSKYFADENVKHKVISSQVYSIKKVIGLLRAGIKKHPSLKLVQIAADSKIYMEEIYEFSLAYINKDYIPSEDLVANLPLVYLVQCSSPKNNPEFWLSYSSLIENSPLVPLACKLEFLYKSYQVSGSGHKTKANKKNAKASNISELDEKIKELIKSYDYSKMRAYDISSILGFFTRAQNISASSKTAIINLIINALNLELRHLSQLEFLDMILLLAFIQSYRQNSLINVIMLQASKLLEPKISNFSELLYTLTILLNFRFIPKELVQLLPKFDSKDRRKFDSIQSIYYISAYCNLFEITHQYNSISHAGLQNIEDILYNNHKQMSIEDKCVIFMKMKYISSLNKSLYIAKSLISDLKSIPQKFFAAIVNNLYNYNYLQLDHKVVFDEIQARLSHFTHKDLVYIGKGLMWHNQGTNKFWLEFFIKLDHLFKKQYLDYTSWICDLYQVIYTLKLQNPELVKEIEMKCEELDFEQIKNLYFERPSMPTSEEITKSEFEVEDILIHLEAKYERQKVIGIHKPDFIINDKIVLEVYGRHHYAEKNIINGATLWRENQLKAIGLQIRAINLQEWNSLGTQEKRISYIKKLISDSIPSNTPS